MNNKIKKPNAIKMMLDFHKVMGDKKKYKVKLVEQTEYKKRYYVEATKEYITIL